MNQNNLFFNNNHISWRSVTFTLPRYHLADVLAMVAFNWFIPPHTPPTMLMND